MRSLVLIAALLAGTFLVYATIWDNGFVYEDRTPDGSILGVSPSVIRPPLDISRPNRSLVLWSEWADFQLFGSDPNGWHGTNLAIHLATGALVYVLAEQLGFLAWFAAGMFLVAPIALESVAYINGRGDLLVTFWIVACLACLTDRSTLTREALTTAGAILCAIVAFASKESAVVLVGLVPLCWWVTRIRGPLAATLTTVSLWYATGGLSTAVDFQTAAKYSGPYIGTKAAGTPLGGMVDVPKLLTLHGWSWAAVQATAAWRYVVLSIWPRGFAIDHDYDHVSVLIRDWALVAWLAIPCVLWRWRRKVDPRLVFGVLLTWIAVAPRLVVPVPLSYFNEHQWRLASVGMALLWALALEWAT
jgi:hypothetical protein